MRRAVADQIKALEELNEIVTRSGRAYDVSQPAPVNAGRSAQPVSPGVSNLHLRGRWLSRSGLQSLPARSGKNRA